MKTKRIVAFRFIALLMLTSLAIIPIVPAGASPAPWDWASSTKHFHCKEGSYRNISIATHPTDAVVGPDKIIAFGCQQYYDVVYSDPWAGGALINITVPKNSFYSEMFYLKPLGPVHAWCQVYLIEDGKGTLALVDNALDVSPITINVTGDGAGGYTESVSIGDGSNDLAGSCILSMPLNMSVYLGTETAPTTLLFKMNFSMVDTTGFIETRIDDTAGPYPGAPSMDGYYKSRTGVRFDAETGAANLVGAGSRLDVLAVVEGIGNTYTDVAFTTTEVLEITRVGGIWTPVDKLALLAPYIGLASTIILAVAATAIFFKYRKKP